MCIRDSPETGWTLDYAADARPVRKRGTHGFDNRDRDMHMVFYASGPAFRKGYRQGSFQNQNMYSQSQLSLPP